MLVALHKSQDILDVSSDRRIIHSEVTEVALRIDDVSGTASVAILFHQAAICFRAPSVNIGQERDVHLTKTSLLAVLLGPSQVRVIRVNRSTDDFTVRLLELRSGLREGNDFRGANKREVQWIEKQHHPLSLVVTEGKHLFTAVRHQGGGFKSRRRLVELGKGHYFG